MRKEDGSILYAPTDLCRFMDSRFASWMDRFVLERPGAATRDEASEDMLLVFERAQEHERAVLERFRDEGRVIVDITKGDDRVAATVEALRSGAEVLYQPALVRAPFAGYPDFLGAVIDAFSVTETALIAVDAVTGVRVNTRRVWSEAESLGLARAIVITRLDSEGADVRPHQERCTPGCRRVVESGVAQHAGDATDP